MGVTIYDLAKELGVSAATVSRVLNRKGDNLISEATKQRVLEAAAEKGYRPNMNARALTTGKSYNIALCIPSRHERLGPHAVRLLESVELRASERGYRLIICGEAKSISGKGQVDGLLMLTDLPVDDLRMLPNDLPRIGIRNHCKEVSNHISWDDFGGVYKAVEYLARLGHRRIVGLFGDVEPASPPVPKVCGFRQAGKDLGLDLMEVYGTHDQDQYQNGFVLTRNLLKKGNDFTAVIARNDLLAVGAMRALRKAGLRVPEDISVVGYNDTSHARCSDPPLTSVRTPIAEAGLLAVDELIRLINGEAEEFPALTLETTITVRESTCPPSV